MKFQLTFIGEVEHCLVNRRPHFERKHKSISVFKQHEKKMAWGSNKKGHEKFLIFMLIQVVYVCDINFLNR